MNDELNNIMEKAFNEGEKHGAKWERRKLQAKYDKLKASHKKLVEALVALIFTSTKLWDEVKPIKDTDGMTVTHPIISQAKYALAEAEAIQ